MIEPTELDEYRIVRLIGRGGMGDVYLAHDTLLDRPVAIKFIRVAKEGQGVREQFFLEARSAARLQHPNVCVIHRIGEWKGQPYIVSELIKGASLASVSLPVPVDEAVEIGIGIARGLAAAHRQGVLHRDIKPANVLRGENGELKLVDFGIAELAPEKVREKDDAPGLQVSMPAPVLPLRAVGNLELVPVGREGDTEPMRIPVPNIRGRSSSRLRGDTLSMAGLGLRRVVGTPDYVAPELWCGQRASRQSDVYALGALLYELCVGEPPYLDVPIEDLPHITQVEDRFLSTADGTIDRRFAEVVDRCLSRDVSTRYASAEEVREALEQLAPAPTMRQIPEGNPYRGLRAFEAEHGALFFGRNREVRAIVERMRSDPLVVVSGDSGVGKSSVCRAGVIPNILLGTLGEERDWSAISLVPGRRPMAALWHALAPIIDQIGEGNGKLKDEAGFFAADVPVGSWMWRALGKSRGLVMFVDQLEELVTLADPIEAEGFCKRLGELLLSSLPVRVLATARSDFFPRLANLTGLGDRLGRALYVLRTLDTEGIREAIVGPVLAKGFRYESQEIVDTLVDSTKDTEEGLPLLQFALAELWELREPKQRVIPAAALLSVGGVAGALARHADAVMGQMLPRAQATAKKMLLALVTSEGTRARRTAAELGVEDMASRLVLETLVHARLVVVREAEAGTVYEVAHEALLSGWHNLRIWLDDSVQLRAARDRLAQGAAEWERLGRSPEALWGVRQLNEVAKVVVDDLPQQDRTFLQASQRALKHKRRRLQVLAVGVPILVAALVALSILRERHSQALRVNAQVAEAKSILAEARTKNGELEKLRSQTLILFQRRDRSAAERDWAKVLGMTRWVTQRYRDASQKLEAALLMENSASEVKSLLAETLYERALLAERDGNEGEQDELLKRLRLFDDGNVYWSKWTAPASITVTSVPEGAEVIVEAYRQQTDGTLVPTKMMGPRRSPIAGPIELKPGSYRLTFVLEGHVLVRYPVLLERGEKVPVHVYLPKRSEIPDGFVYVPPGRSLFGARQDEDLRSWFLTIPEQQIHTRGYLIQKTEVTFGEWISYLESLPERERRLRTPGSSATAWRGNLQLRRLENGQWQLRFRPNKQTYSAVDGRIHYDGREKRSVQSWQRLPVGGVSFPDATAYAEYLQTKPSPVLGARLCSEFEWERASRGADSRPFPHGFRLDPDDANFDVTYGQKPEAFGPDEVGSHERSRSPFDIDDMSGNVWEWVSGADCVAAARGGSYYDSMLTNAVINRQKPDVSFRDPVIGVRICADLPWDDGARPSPDSREQGPH